MPAPPRNEIATLLRRRAFRGHLGLDGIDQRHACVIARAHRLAACRHDDRLGQLAARVSGGVGAHAPVVLERGDRRVREELEIVVRQPVLLVDDGRALGLDADADTGAGKPRRAQTEKRRVGRMTHAHDPRPRAASLDACSERAENGRKRMACDRLEELDAEGGTNADDNILGIVAWRGRSHDLIADAFRFCRLVHGLRAQNLLAGQHVADGDKLFATFDAHAIPSARPQIVVGIVDGAEDPPVADHGRGLQIVARDAQSNDLEQVLRLLLYPRLASALMTSTTVIEQCSGCPR